MVSHYYITGPRNGIPSVWKADRGLTVSTIDALAQSEGLRVVQKPQGKLTRDALYDLLKMYGPIWSAGRFLDASPTAGHVVVLTGVQGPFVLFNDPWEPVAKKRSAEWFSNRLYALPNAMLAKDTQRS
jgi:hypothetical protein